MLPERHWNSVHLSYTPAGGLWDQSWCLWLDHWRRSTGRKYRVGHFQMVPPSTATCIWMFHLAEPDILSSLYLQYIKTLFYWDKNKLFDW